MALRESLDAAIVNEPRTIGGLPWTGVVVGIGFASIATLMIHNWYLLPMALVAMAFLRGAAKRDPLFFDVYKRHRVQAAIYSPAPFCRPAVRNQRPVGYGRYDPN